MLTIVCVKFCHQKSFKAFVLPSWLCFYNIFSPPATFQHKKTQKPKYFKDLQAMVLEVFFHTTISNNSFEMLHPSTRTKACPCISPWLNQAPFVVRTFVCEPSFQKVNQAGSSLVLFRRWYCVAFNAVRSCMGCKTEFLISHHSSNSSPQALLWAKLRTPMTDLFQRRKLRYEGSVFPFSSCGVL